MRTESKTVLIVDDILYVRKTLRQILGSRGFEIAGEAENGEEAIRMYREIRPDFVTMDLVMPILNGVEATREILKEDPDACIIVLSAMMQENLVTAAIEAGAKDYILKPFQTDEVMEVIRGTVPGATIPTDAGGAA